MKILVFGASGYIGTNLIPKLHAPSLSVRASARHIGVLEARGWQGVELVSADALKPASLEAALEGIDLAYYLVHSMAAGGDFARLDREAAANFRDAAATAGVRRIIYLVVPIPLHTYREAIVAALEQERTLSVPARWTEGALAFRGYNPEISYYSKGERTEVVAHAAAPNLWKVVASIGGDAGYYFANPLWRIRGLLDRLVGGPGMRRGRRVRPVSGWATQSTSGVSSQSIRDVD